MAAEALSEHPLAQAVVEGAKTRGTEIPAASEFESETGKGVRTRVDGKSVLAGRLSFLEHECVDTTPLRAASERLAREGKSPPHVAVDGRALGALGVADTVEENSTASIAALQRMGIEVVMITGDNRHMP